MLSHVNRMAAAAAVASTMLLSGFSSSYAATAATPTVVKVSLTGEADNPMGITLDVAKVKPGLVEFDVTNDAVGTDHEVVLVKLKSASQKIAVDPKKDRIDESKLKSMGEVAGLKPGDKGVLKVKLAAGDYLLLCNHKSHYHMGMFTAFTVAP